MFLHICKGFFRSHSHSSLAHPKLNHSSRMRTRKVYKRVPSFLMSLCLHRFRTRQHHSPCCPSSFSLSLPSGHLLRRSPSVTISGRPRTKAPRCRNACATWTASCHRLNQKGSSSLETLGATTSPPSRSSGTTHQPVCMQTDYRAQCYPC
jgi:hypothetical protein